MDYIYALLRRYPNRIKYGILILDAIFMMVAIKTYVNYVSIETAIENATLEQQTRTEELAFTQNFLVNYEKSEYARYFLEHENNMLLDGEYIIKFEDMYKKQQNTTGENQSYADIQAKDLASPKNAWKKFIIEQLK